MPDAHWSLEILISLFAWHSMIREATTACTTCPSGKVYYSFRQRALAFAGLLRSYTVLEPQR